MLEQEGWQQHDPRVMALDREVGWIVTAVISGGWAFATLLIWIAGGWNDFGAIFTAVIAAAWVPLTIAVAVVSYRWPAVHYRHARYRLTPERIEIERGVLWRNAILVPRSRVQHLNVSRGPLERRHGLATLTIYTAGTQHSAVPLRGLADEEAVRLRDELLPRVRTGDGV